MDALKTPYNLIAIFKILTTFTWSFSIVTMFFIGGLLNPRSPLLTWSREHKYWTFAAYSFLQYLPIFLVWSLSSRLLTLAPTFDQQQVLPILAPRTLWIIRFCITGLAVFSLAGLTSLKPSK